jgi:hypothetical protein
MTITLTEPGALSLLSFDSVWDGGGPPHEAFAPRTVVRQKRPQPGGAQDADERSRATLVASNPTSNSGGMIMAMSDQLEKLAQRAKELEDRAAAAKQKNKSDLENDVKQARKAADDQGESLKKNAEKGKDRLSAWWFNLQRGWNEHLKAAHKHMDDRKSEHDLKSAQRAADRADDDASFAVDYAFAAIEEAEYAILDAELAHMDVDDLVAAGDQN